jgi:hypothetical protein
VGTSPARTVLCDAPNAVMGKAEVKAKLMDMWGEAFVLAQC